MTLWHSVMESAQERRITAPSRESMPRIQLRDAPLDPDAVVLLSGGADSAACLGFYLEIARAPCALFVDYGQPAARQEEASARHIARHYGVSLHRAQWMGSRSIGSGLIPGRNAFLLSAALLERPESATVVALGIHAGTGYVDCSSQFVKNMQSVYDLYSNGKVTIACPFSDWTKAEVLSYAQSAGVPLTLTYSCETGGNPPCGHCRSCLDRVCV